MGRTLVTGGVRSGKSRFAEELAAATPHPVTYVATAASARDDPEWQWRLAHHRGSRPSGWTVVETAGSPTCKLTALVKGTGADRTLLVDSLGTWLADRMASAHGELLADPLALERALEADAAALVAAFSGSAATAIVVGEEVGSGIVPAYVSGRVFRDVLGRLQQALAADCERVYLATCGFVLDLRALGRPIAANRPGTPSENAEPGTPAGRGEPGSPPGFGQPGEIRARSETGTPMQSEPVEPTSSSEPNHANVVAACVSAIVPFDVVVAARARDRVDDLTKPLGALGRLEELAVQLCGIAGSLVTTAYDSAAILVAAGDHGVSAENVSAYPAEVTTQMVGAFAAGHGAINALARMARADLYVADFGMRVAPAPHPALLDARVGAGTANLAREAALTDEQVDASLAAGIGAFEALCARGTYDVLALGEMGIGNTTSAAAIVAALTSAPIGEVVGRGTGVDAAGLARKVATLERALGRFEKRDWRTVAREVGGFEIVGMAGVLLAAGRRRMPVVLDGFIVSAAALLAQRIAPAAQGGWIAGHVSAERGHGIALAALGLRPLLNLDLRLGEATGAALALPLVEAASRILCEMQTFAEAGVSTAS